MLTQIYNKKAEKGQIQNVPLGRKFTPDSLKEKSTMLKEIKILNKCLILNGIQRVVTQCHVSSKLSFQLVKIIEEKHKQQRKTLETESWWNEFGQVSQLPAIANRTWQFQPCGSFLKVKSTTKGLCNLLVKENH